MRGAFATGVSAAFSSVFGADKRESVATKPQTGGIGNVREYWISVENVNRNVVPSGYDEFMGTTWLSTQTSFTGLSFIAFTPNWETPLPPDPELGTNSGVPGPIIRAEVGDTVVIHFRNNDQVFAWPHSMHFHGFLYAPPSDGAFVFSNGFAPGTAVRPGETYDYVLQAVESSVGTWVYHDHSLPESLNLLRRISNGLQVPTGAKVAKPAGMAPPDNDGSNPASTELTSEMGLVGISAITPRGETPPDREFVVFMQDIYQADIPSLGQDFDLLNGYAFLGNTPTFTAEVGDRVRWRVGVLGTEFHVFHIHAHRWLHAGSYVDAVVLGPSASLTVDFVEDNPGSWLFHCHVPDHMMGGMVGRYNVLQKSATSPR